MRQLLFILILMCVFVNVKGQEKEVSGYVRDATGKLLIGVSIREKGTNNGTVTNEEGFYSLKLMSEPSEAILLFSYTGYTTIQKEVEDRAHINAIMSMKVKELDRLVVVGYGQKKKKDLTGAVSTVNTSEMSKTPIPDLSCALVGRASGVQVKTSQGAPGAPVSIKIRGGGSITQSNEPLYVIDGIPSSNGLDFLDPTDIASIDILKDASATAVYGARGANGVVLITTKSGEKGNPKVTYNGRVGMKWLANKLSLLSPLEYAKLEYERSMGDEDEAEDFQERYGKWEDLPALYSDRPGIDWQDEMFGSTALHQYHKVGINGGGDNTTYYFTASHDDNQGQMMESKFRRNQINLKLNQDVGDRLSAKVNVRYTEEKVTGMSTSDQVTSFTKLRQILQYRPTIGKNGNDANLLDFAVDPALESLSGRVSVNPLVSAKAEQRDRLNKSFRINGKIDFEIVSNLHYQFSYGYTFTDREKKWFNKKHSVLARRSGGPKGYLQDAKRFSMTYTNLLTYKKSIKNNHEINVLLGQEGHYRRDEWFRAGSAKFPSDEIGLANLSLGTLPDIPESHKEDSRLLSYFGRIPNFAINIIG